MGKFTVWTGHSTDWREWVGGMESCLSEVQGYQQHPHPLTWLCTSCCSQERD